MTDAPAASIPPPAPYVAEESMTMPVVIYVLYLLGYFTGGLSTLIGLVIAYVQKAQASPRALSHYVFQINTFWITLIALAISIVLAIMGMPLLLLHGVGVIFFVLSGLMGLAITVWFLVRCVVGLIRAAQGEAYPMPRSWLL